MQFVTNISVESEADLCTFCVGFMCFVTAIVS